MIFRPLLANPVWDDQIRQTVVDYINSLRMRSDARITGPVTTPVYRYIAKDSCAMDQAAYDYHEYFEHSRSHAAFYDAYPTGCSPNSQCTGIWSPLVPDVSAFTITKTRETLWSMFSEKDGYPELECFTMFDTGYYCVQCGHWWIITDTYTKVAVGYYYGAGDHGTLTDYNFYN